jgi:DNA-binding XRE family transcriptional regulator
MKLSDLKPQPRKSRVGTRKTLLKRPPKTRLLTDIATLRRSKGVSLRQVGKATGISIAVLCQAELGCTPALETALKIAAFVELPVEKIWALKRNGK